MLITEACSSRSPQFPALPLARLLQTWRPYLTVYLASILIAGLLYSFFRPYATDHRVYVWLQELFEDPEQDWNDDTRNAHHRPRLELRNMRVQREENREGSEEGTPKSTDGDRCRNARQAGYLIPVVHRRTAQRLGTSSRRTALLTDTRRASPNSRNLTRHHQGAQGNVHTSGRPGCQ